VPAATAATYSTTQSYMQPIVLSWQLKQMLRQWVLVHPLLLLLVVLVVLPRCCWGWIWPQMWACTVQATSLE
jgi:hypothetical protein